MKVFIALVTACAATAAVADDRTLSDILLSGPSVEQQIRQSEDRMRREMDSRAEQQELERRLDSIFYPTPRESCINWVIDCGRASGGRR